jgi:hypothetical protein
LLIATTAASDKRSQEWEQCSQWSTVASSTSASIALSGWSSSTLSTQGRAEDGCNEGKYGVESVTGLAVSGSGCQNGSGSTEQEFGQVGPAATAATLFSRWRRRLGTFLCGRWWLGSVLDLDPFVIAVALGIAADCSLLACGGILNKFKEKRIGLNKEIIDFN